MPDNLRILTGYDTRGTVCDAGEFVLRKTSSEYINETLAIYDCYKRYNLEQYGIVETELNEADKSLRHKKHIISYPFEWTANMLRDAVLFHVNLLLNLDKHGLTLKDALPNNIVFDFPKPVFVDFFSILSKEDLVKEEWLPSGRYDDPRFAVLDIMFLPYMFIPLMTMAKKGYIPARKMLSERACNLGGSPPSWNDFLSESGTGIMAKIRSRIDYIFLQNNLGMRRFFYSHKKDGFTNFCRYLTERIEECDVTPPPSGYVSYYEDKNEKFDILDQSRWGDKQKNIHDVILRLRPKSVLDIGANTGWFSILSEKLGAEVISTDIDESSIDSLYLYSKSNNLKILPLKLSFDELTKEIFGIVDSHPVYRDRDFETNSLFLPAITRLRSDMVLALGLVHHLILGEGKDIGGVFEILSSLADKTLILEFVGLDDDKIQGEPSFFRHLNKFTSEDYNLDLFVWCGKKFFSNIDIMSSHPGTRKLLVLSK